MELLTVKETADLLRVSTVTVRRYIASGKLVAVRVGRNIRIRRDDAERVIEPAEPQSDPKFIAEDRAKYFSSSKSGPPVPAQSKLADTSDESLLENNPWSELVGVIDDDGPTDVAENHDNYLAEAYADTHEGDESPFSNPDGDSTITPREWLLKNHPMFWTLPGGAHEGEPEYVERCNTLMAEARARNFGSGKPVDWDSPLWDIVGMIKDDGPTDMGEIHDKYLAETRADALEESLPSLKGTDPRFAGKSKKWLLKNHPLMKMKGFIKDDGPDDYSVNHDKYLADAYADNHEE